VNVQSFLRQLKEHEGVRLKPYKDTVGKTTIGCGRNLTDRGISDAEMHFLLANDIDLVIKQLDGALPWWRGLDEVRQLVLADMCFNLGLGGLLGFHSTLQDIRDGDYKNAALGMRASKWFRQVGRRAERLARMMETGAPVPY
jgi:lysozyme